MNSKLPVGTIINFAGEDQYKKISDNKWISLTSFRIVLLDGKDPSDIKSYIKIPESQVPEDKRFGFLWDDSMVLRYYHFATIKI